jgi:multidrug efflux system membrane fusion protein
MNALINRSVISKGKPTTFPVLRSATFLLFLAATLTGCSKQQQAPPRPAVPVTVASVAQKTMPVQVKAIGTVQPYNTVAVKSQVEGTLTGVHFTEGQDVGKGQLLFTIDRRQIEADLRRAEATLAKDEAQARNAASQAARYAKLLKEGVVAKEQADEIASNAEALEAAVQADRAAVQSYKVQLTYSTIEAPFAGRTGNLRVHRGNLIKENDTDNPLVTINQITPIYVEFSVPEQFLADIKRYAAQGQLQVEAVIPQQEDRPAEGKLTFVDNAVDRETGTIKLKSTFANKDRRLWPGQFVNVVLTLARQPDAIVAPAQAVQSGQQGQYVFVVKNDLTVEARPVKVGREVEGEVVVQAGLRAGERVVTDGQLRLVPGAKVEVKDGTQAQEKRP